MCWRRLSLWSPVAFLSSHLWGLVPGPLWGRGLSLVSPSWVLGWLGDVQHHSPLSLSLSPPSVCLSLEPYRALTVLTEYALTEYALTGSLTRSLNIHRGLVPAH